jgi:DNA processing protein
MTSEPDRPDGACACGDCLQRSRLLAELIVPLDYCARDPSRLLDVLALADENLIAALGGRRRAELEATLRQRPDPPDATAAACPGGAGAGASGAACRHDPRYPRRMLDARAPRLLFASAGAEQMVELASAPVVAVFGSAHPSDYGAEVAGSIAAGLAVCGVSVATVLVGGVAESARLAVAGVGARQLAIAPDGLAAGTARGRRSENCCVLAELPPEVRGRTFGAVSALRTLVVLGQVILCVEARASARELLAAKLAASFDRPVAAVPGRVTSPWSAGPNALLQGGAELARSAEDVLALLPASDRGAANARRAPLRGVLEPRLQSLLERVAGGRDTLARLCEDERDPGAILHALSELELLGLLGRGEGGCYVPRCSPGEDPTCNETSRFVLKQRPCAADDC